MNQSAANRKDIRRLEKKARLIDVNRLEFVTLMMSNPAGRAYAHNHLERCHLFHSSFDRDTSQMAFNEGERNQGLQLLNDIMMTCPDQFIQMMREANERYISNDRGRPTDLDASSDSAVDEHRDGSPAGRDDQGSESDTPKERHFWQQ